MEKFKSSIRKLQVGFATAACLAALFGAVSPDSPLNAQSRKSSYGLGLPKSATTAGATRTTPIPLIALLAPEDGGRTLSARPTFYWYISSNTPSVTTGDNKQQYELSFLLRDKPGLEGTRIFDVRGKLIGSGLYKFSLPATAPALEVGSPQRWDIRLQGSSLNAPQALNAAIVRDEPTPEVNKALNAAKTELEKARVYTNYFYWYDALNAYSNWIEANPKDTKARLERVKMLEAILPDIEGFRKSDSVSEAQAQANLSSILNQVGVASMQVLTPNTQAE